MHSKNTITIVLLCMRIYLVETFIPPTISSYPILQTGQWNYATGDKQIGLIHYTIQFDQAFVESPNVGMIINQYDYAALLFNDSSYANFPQDIVPFGIKLTSFVLRVDVYKNTNQLSFSWIATSSQDIFIYQKALTASGKINFKLARPPLDLNKLLYFIFIRGGYNQKGQIVTSGIDKINSYIQININNGGLPDGESERFFFIVVNTEDTIDQRSHIRLLANSFTSANQKNLEINTIPVLAGQKQNMYIGLSSYYNPNSIWNFSILPIFSNQSYINYSLQFDPQSTILLQYVQIEILNCSDLQSIFQGDQCVCNPQYYQNQSTCQQCATFCNTCSAIDQCQSCKTISNLSLQNGLCLCNTGYFIQATSCQACDITCYQCSGVSFNQCTSCNSTTQHRIFNSNVCDCDSGYYQYNSQCAACNYTCLTCSQSTTCDTCDPLTMKRNMTNSQCVCLDGYYEIANQAICQQCDITCLTCITTASQCRSCNSTNQRSILNNACPCLDGYYESVNQANCQYCDTTCLTCVIQATNCQTCAIQNHRQIMHNVCLCMDGYYQQANQAMCEHCVITCQTCVTLASNCQTCAIAYNRIFKSYICPCMDGYYGQDNRAQCLKCHLSCLKCNGGSNNQCTECDLRRNLTNSRCICLQGTYNDINQVCQGEKCQIFLACHYTCQGCNGPQQNQCTNCGEIKIVNRLMNSSICSCEQSYYTAQYMAICQQCHFRCKTCDGGIKNNCLSCFDQQFRQIISKQCICRTNYLQSQDQDICIPCIAQCINCPKLVKNEEFLDVNCECDKNCVQDYKNTQHRIQQLSQGYNLTRNNKGYGAFIGTFGPLGFLSQILNSPQMILTTFPLETQKPQIVFILQRSLSVYLFQAYISGDQLQPNGTSIEYFNHFNFTSESMVNFNNTQMRLIGFSDLIIYTAIIQLSSLAILFTIYVLLKGFSLKSNLYQNQIKTILYHIVRQIHTVIEGCFLYLFTQILMNFKTLSTQDRTHLKNIQYISSCLISITIFTIYVSYLTKTLFDIDSYMKKKNLILEGLSQSDNGKLTFIKDHGFYLSNNPMRTRLQSQYTVLCQYKKLLFSVIIVFGAGNVDIQLLLFFNLGLLCLAYQLVFFPFKNQIIGFLDQVIQVLFLTFLISTYQDYLDVQEIGYQMVSGRTTSILIIIILVFDVIKVILKITFAIVLWFKKRQNGQKQIKEQNNHIQTIPYPIFSIDFSNNLQESQITAKNQTSAINTQQIQFKHPRYSEVWDIQKYEPDL